MIDELKSGIVRSAIFHTPRNAFQSNTSLEMFADGALVMEAGRIVALGDFSQVRRLHPSVPVHDLSGGFVLPGFIDTHVHYPQTRIIGGLGYSLLEWLNKHALPEELRMVGRDYAAAVASEFLHALASHGTTAALVFGSHFVPAMELLFDAAIASGQRIVSGLVVSDRVLPTGLLQTPDQAYLGNNELIRRIRNHRNLGYAVTPRFALSASDAMLEVCQTLLKENPASLFQTHINENLHEMAEVQALFPDAGDYLGVYEQFNLTESRSILAHNLHPTGSELARMAASKVSVAHCPCSNAALGSGLFPMRRHLEAQVHFALGTDVGAGTGFGMLKEGLQAYLLQRIHGEGFSLTPEQLLYLATRAGAEALGLEEETGDFSIGKSADFVYLRPLSGSPLAAAVAHADSATQILASLFTLGDSHCVKEVRVSGRVIYQS